MKKSRISQLISLALATSVVLCSCYYGPIINTPYYVPIDRQKANHYYAPTGTNAPLLADKNDISFSLTGSLGSENKGTSIQTAYVAAKHIGLMANYSSLSNSDYLGDLSNQHVVEFGAGYVKKLNDQWLFESYGGAGFGKMENFHQTGLSTVKTSNYFLQPAIAVSSKNQAFQFGFISKFNMVNFNLGDTTFNNDKEPFVTNQMKLINDQSRQFFWEPGIVVRGGWKWLRVQMSYQVSTDFSDNGINCTKDNFSMGVMIRLNTAKKKK